MASKKFPDRFNSLDIESEDLASAVAATMATRAPGTMRNLGGSFRHSNKMPMTVPPTITSCNS